jgi:hypothetical protein
MVFIIISRGRKECNAGGVDLQKWQKRGVVELPRALAVREAVTRRR